MPDPSTFQAASDAGGWATAVVILATLTTAFLGLLALVVRALIQGDLVAGSIHRRALDRGDSQDQALVRLTGSVDAFSNQTAATLKELRADVDELRGLPRRRD